MDGGAARVMELVEERLSVKHKLLNRGFFYNFCLYKIGKFIKRKVSMVIILYTDTGKYYRYYYEQYEPIGVLCTEFNWKIRQIN